MTHTWINTYRFRYGSGEEEQKVLKISILYNFEDYQGSSEYGIRRKCYWSYLNCCFLLEALEEFTWCRTGFRRRSCCWLDMWTRSCNPLVSTLQVGHNVCTRQILGVVGKQVPEAILELAMMLKAAAGLGFFCLIMTTMSKTLHFSFKEFQSTFFPFNEISCVYITILGLNKLMQ